MAILLPKFKWTKNGTRIIAEYINESGNGVVNPSLIFDKYLFWEEYNGKPTLNIKRGGNRIDCKLEHFKRIIKLGSILTPARYAQLKDRKNSLPRTRPFTLTTGTRLVINHGDESILENSIALHPHYGFPTIPGSAIKGVTRHYSEEFPEKPDNLIKKIFGNSSDDKDAEEGSIIFLDAWPESTGNNFLETDVFTPHYQRYYQGTDLPRDDQSPIPVNFLAVKKGVKFEFTIAPSSICEEAKAQYLIGKTVGLVTDALRMFGIGAKTGSNYGYFNKDELYD